MTNRNVATPVAQDKEQIETGLVVFKVNAAIALVAESS